MDTRDNPTYALALLMQATAQTYKVKISVSQELRDRALADPLAREWFIKVFGE